MIYDVVIVGGGIVGLSVAMALARRASGQRLLLLEKETRWASHQTGHNSGVIHSGIYYKPGSLKARFARQGNQRLQTFCAQHGIAYEICGKVIVATRPAELPRLDALHQRGLANGLRVRLLSAVELHEIEPHVQGLAALHVADAGIVDYGAVARAFGTLAAEAGADLRLGTAVLAVHYRAGTIAVDTTAGTVETRFLVNCAGLHSDRIARADGVEGAARIVPFRGEYYELIPARRSLVRHLVYPVPDPAFPFLGVHFTRMIDGGVHAGPNAVLSLKREGYRKRDIDLRDALDTLSYGGFWRLAARHWRVGGAEAARSLSKALFVRSLRRLVPTVRAADLVPAGAGVRAQALTSEGLLLDDFLLVRRPQSLHVCNAPSPAATASIPIGEHIAEQVL